VAELLHLIVWTPSETVIDVEQVEWVRVVLADEKPLTIWPGHSRLLAETAVEALRYADREGTHNLDLPSGIVCVQDSAVTLFLAGTLEEALRAEEEELGRSGRLALAMLDALGKSRVS
jgi:F0F1-type ATP synthase epsilon subunit